MTVDPANAQELMHIAAEIGADVLTGTLRYPSETGGWQVGHLDLSEYLDRYRNHQLVVIIAVVGQAPLPSYTCGVCGFVMSELGECPRCKLIVAEQARQMQDTGETRDVLTQVADFLDRPEGL